MYINAEKGREVDRTEGKTPYQHGDKKNEN